MVFAAALAAGPALAGHALSAPELLTQSDDDAYRVLVEALVRQGYTIESVSRTMLQRIRITARNEYHLREIILSPASGEVLRDAILRQFKPMPKAEPGAWPPAGRG